LNKRGVNPGKPIAREATLPCTDGTAVGNGWRIYKPMHTASRDSNWFGKGCLLIACLVGGVALISCCGGWFAFRSWFLGRAERANPVAVAFLNDVCAGRAEEAYARTSATFRAQVSFETFRMSLRHYSSFGGPYSSSDLAIAGAGGSLTDPRYIAMIGDIKTGRQLLNISLVEEGGVWQVDDFTSPDTDGGLENSIGLLLERRRR
jgi:hypothetical protein